MLPVSAPWAAIYLAPARDVALAELQTWLVVALGELASCDRSSRSLVPTDSTRVLLPHRRPALSRATIARHSVSVQRRRSSDLRIPSTSTGGLASGPTRHTLATSQSHSPTLDPTHVWRVPLRVATTSIGQYLAQLRLGCHREPRADPFRSLLPSASKAVAESIRNNRQLAFTAHAPVAE